MLPGALTPPLQAHLSRLGSRLSFAEAASELGHLKGVRVAAATARRRTQTDGRHYAALQDAAAAQVVATAPPAPAGPAVQQVSVDGTMVHLSDGSWREVRTLAIGTVGPGRTAATVRSSQISYFARLADAATFTELAAGEVHRRGVETAGTVAGVSDGAPWCQSFLDVHRPDAVRILDVPHAAQRLGVVAEAVWGEGAAASAWAAEQRRALGDGAAALVLDAVRALPVAASRDPAIAAQVQTETLGYLAPRQDQMRYAAFRAQGLPIGSGMVESGGCPWGDARGRCPLRWGGAAVGGAQHHADGGLAQCGLLGAVGRGVAGDCPGAAPASPAVRPAGCRRLGRLRRDPDAPRGRRPRRRRAAPRRPQADRQRPPNRRSPLEASPATPATSPRKTLTRTPASVPRRQPTPPLLEWRGSGWEGASALGNQPARSEGKARSARSPLVPAGTASFSF